MALFGDNTNEFWYIPVLPLFILVGCIVIMVFAHTGTQYKIDEYNLEYEGLCKRYELIQSNYEDISKSDVVKDITFWNKKVCSYKYWSDNLWTDWFWNKRVADSLKYIDLGGENTK